MRMLVSGGAGFIGSHLVERLVLDGHHVVVVDNFSHGRRENLRLAMASGQCVIVPHDILDEDLTATVCQAQPEVIVHLAAQIDVRASVESPRVDAMANVMGTIALLEAARKAHARKVILASSVAIFGPPAMLPVTEVTPANPLSPYAVSKLSAEYYLSQYHQLYGLETTSLILTNTYGPRQDPHGEAGVVAIFAEHMLQGLPTRVFGDGSNSRDYVFVDDVVDAFIRAAGTTANGRRLVIGTGEPTTDEEIHTMVATAVGEVVEPEFSPPRLGDLPHMVVDATVARDILGWIPHVPLSEGVAKTVQSLRETLAISTNGRRLTQADLTV